MRIWIAAFLVLAASPAAAILPSPDAAASTDQEASEPSPQLIDDTQDAGADERIETRITEIFAELPAFENVSVEVNEGVVSLSGLVADQADIARAENIAGRVSGVVTVENAVERDLSVEGSFDGLTSLQDRIDGFVAMLPLIALALVVGIVIAAFGYLLASLSGLWRKLAPNVFLAELIASALRFIFAILGIVVALDILGAAALLGAVLGGAGVVGIALGFAMRDTIENYVASLMLSLRQPFRANDHVLIDDLEGRVIRLTSRATVLMTLDGNHLRIPNGQVFKAVITNFTRNPQRRFEFDLGIDADDDPNAARMLGVDTMSALGFVLDQPEPRAQTEQVGDSNIVIRFFGWVDQQEADFLKSRSLAIAAVKTALEDAGFGLPEPIYRLRFDSRTDPLPIGRSGRSADKSASEEKPARRVAAPAVARAEDTRPETEIEEMVEQERREDGEQADDLLDPDRPVE